MREIGVQEGYPDKISVSESHRGNPEDLTAPPNGRQFPRKEDQVGGIGKITWVVTVQEKGEQVKMQNNSDGLAVKPKRRG